MAPAVEKANQALKAKGEEPLPDGLMPQSLRRTFASLLIAAGENPVHVKGQLGHVDAALTLNHYAAEMSRRDGEQERLKALLAGEFGHSKGTEADSRATVEAAKEAKEPVESGVQGA